VFLTIQALIILTGKIIVWGHRNLSGRKCLRSTYALFITYNLNSVQRRGDLTILNTTVIDFIIVLYLLYNSSEVCHPRFAFKLYGEVNSVKKHNYKIWLNDGVY